MSMIWISLYLYQITVLITLECFIMPALGPDMPIQWVNHEGIEQYAPDMCKCPAYRPDMPIQWDNREGIRQYTPNMC